MLSILIAVYMKISRQHEYWYWYNDHWAISTGIPGWNAWHFTEAILMCFYELEYHALEKMKFMLNSPIYHCAATISAVQQVGGKTNWPMACPPCHYFLTVELTEEPGGWYNIGSISAIFNSNLLKSYLSIAVLLVVLALTVVWDLWLRWMMEGLVRWRIYIETASWGPSQHKDVVLPVKGSPC